MSWAEIKKAINGSLGTSKFKPIDEIIGDAKREINGGVNSSAHDIRLKLDSQTTEILDKSEFLALESAYRSYYNSMVTKHLIDRDYDVYVCKTVGYSPSSMDSIAASNSSVVVLHPSYEKIPEDFFNDSVVAVILNPRLSNVEGAFAGRANLSVIDLTGAPLIKKLGRGAFAQCTNMMQIFIPGNITDIEDNTFDGCSGLQLVRFGKGVRSIGEYVFKGCELLYRVSLPNTIEEIDENAFSDSSLTDIYVPWGEEEIAGAPWGADNATVHYNSTFEV